MTLFTATVLTAGSLLFLGIGLFCKNTSLKQLALGLLRSHVTAIVVFGAATAGFLWQVAHLSAADFGNYRSVLFSAFLLIAVLSFVYVSDFLAVRGLAILIMLAASVVLDSAYMQTDYPQRLLLVSFVYVMIVVALYVGVAPFRMRDFLEWLFGSVSRCRLIGALLFIYGALLAVSALSYECVL